MSLTKASLVRRAALTLIAGAAIAAPMGAKADALGGLSVRVGAFFPANNQVRDFTDFAVWGAGLDYKIPWVPKVFNGDSWSTSISVDFHYSQRRPGIVRYWPVSINQVFTFEEKDGRRPYAGFCLTAATFNASINRRVQTGSVSAAASSSTSSTLTRFGGGVIIGVNFGKNVYWDARYEWIDRHGLAASPEGVRSYLGYRF